MASNPVWVFLKVKRNRASSTKMIETVSAVNSQIKFLKNIRAKKTPKQKVLFMLAAPSRALREMVMVFFVFFAA